MLLFAFSYLVTLPAGNDAACPHLGNWLCMYLNRGEEGHYRSESDVKASYVNPALLFFVTCLSVNERQYKCVRYCIFMERCLNLSVVMLLKQVTALGRHVALHPPLVFKIMCCAQGHQHHLRERLATVFADKMRILS